MSAGPGLDVSAGVHQGQEDTVGWVVLSNSGNSEARDVYVELYHREGFDGRALSSDVELPILLWREPHIRRQSKDVQISFPMMVFREIGLPSDFEVTPFTHAWIAYRDRLGGRWGFYVPIDHTSAPADLSSLAPVAKTAVDGLPILRVTEVAKFKLGTEVRWRRQLLMRRVVRWFGGDVIRLPSPPLQHIRRLKTKNWTQFAERSFAALGGPDVTSWPVIAFFSEDKPGHGLWHGRAPHLGRRLHHALREHHSTYGDVEVLIFATPNDIIDRFRVRARFDDVQALIQDFDRGTGEV